MAAAASSSARPAVLALAGLALLLLLCVGPGGISGNKLKQMLQKREAPAPAKTNVAVDENKAKAFLGSPKRAKRQLWDRSRPEVQQWYQQFLYMGFDEAKFEDDITYWLNRDRNGHDYYGDYYQRHYDEDAAIGPRSPHSFRHGASVNYDDY
ncbi:augurin [Perognathus longimembris pacificus]|uniref:augurin n=1 Tax=Perognathus longimembris pacificus TaxID=214514 RepID=UPI00201A00E9|nr:augurin [Perognathus longimembris pacificus]